MKSLLAEGSYQKAAEIADTINWRKIKNVTALARAGEVYEKVERYDESREVLLTARSRSPMGRTILYRLVCVAVKLEKYDEAWSYYKEFVEVAPRDNLKYILKYKISKAEGADYQALILCLEDLKEQEPTEEWGYELAYLYHKAKMPEKCVEACDELFLYFGYGTYVEKALELKKLYQPLSDQQEESYKRFKQEKESIQEIETEKIEMLETKDSVTEVEEVSKTEEVVKAEEVSQMQNLQTVLQKGVQKFMGEVKKEDLAQSRMNAIKRLVKDIPYIRQKEEKQTDFMTEYLKQRELETVSEPLEEKKPKPMEPETKSLEPMKSEMVEEETKPLEPMKSEMVEEETKPLEPMKSEMVEEETKPLEPMKSEMVEEETKSLEPMKPEMVEEETKSLEPMKSEMVEEETKPLELMKSEMVEEETKSLELMKSEMVEEETKPLEQKELKMVRWEKQTELNKKEEEQEGQIRIVLPNGQVFESHITGEMSFNEVMSEWERTIQIATSAFKEGQSRQKSMKEKASQEAGDILERLMDVIPGANAGQRPKPVTIKEKKQTVLEEKKETEETEMAVQMVSDINQILQKEIESISTENAQIEERIVAVQESVNIAQKDTIQERNENQELAAEIHAVMERQSQFLEEKDTVLEEIEKKEIVSENILEDEIFVNTFDDTIQKEFVSETFLQEPDIMDESAIKEESKSEEIQKDIQVEEIVIEEINLEEEMLFETSELKETSFEEILEKPKIQIEESPIREEPDEEFLLELSQELIGKLAESTEEMIPKIEFPEDINLEIELTELSPEQRETFSYITHIKGMEEQICIALSGIASRLKEGRKANTGNLIVMGNSGSGKTVFATNFIKVLQQMTGKLTGKIGKIEASVLNEKDINGLYEKIAGGCLIIESAGNLTEESTRRLSFLLEEDTKGTLVILEGLKREIEKVLMQDKEFASKFSERIKIPIFTNDELIVFARAYAKENGYVIDDMGILALYNSISNIKKLDRETTIAEVKEVVDAAIVNVESGALKKAFSIFASSRFDEEDYVILHEKDFN